MVYPGAGRRGPGLRFVEICMDAQFNAWWDSDEMEDSNPYEPDTPIWWAWEGWQARASRTAQEPVAWLDTRNGGLYHKIETPLSTDVPLYTAPQPAAVAVPDGWQLVPKKPTKEMMFAGGNNRESGEDFEAYRPSECAAIYRDMLAAAPKPENKP